MIDVPGARIHYQLEGNGPLLLISQSGEGDADRSTDLIRQLVDDYTVLTYDRRGLSRSKLEEPGATIADHADDVHRLLQHVTDEPVAMLGCSLGAVIGLHLTVKHPTQLHTLVAHEPIAPWLLPEPKLHRDELTELRDQYLANGLQATIPAIVRSLGIDPSNGEPGRTDFPMDANRLANFDYFIRHDFTAAADDDLDPAALSAGGVRIVPAAGTTTPRTVFDYQCAEALAELLGQDLQTFPGGHNGNLSHPKAYAQRLREVLSRR
ncbi:pimeloyl-ACP methyl ester carboxylesterase [Kribbella sp. VKM Ac-2569]|uniref:alpha/beta fold hydrolase n=1 Tax=Kribbella sp. VKM Ac-2569 TaxID=2512220 RepID=UPI0010D3C365|nr:alpha/beta hydrolase [Kribbella sp. VKM Ac-2569]RZT17230.1 pimeloyl-ACP methyl ester carboxylesterase [Kribbella sp. VKM Ac-2569]